MAEITMSEAALWLRSVYKQHASLAKNSAAIAIGTGFSALFGFAFWLLAARYFSPQVIGETSALLSLVMVIGLVGEGGIGTMLTGEIVLWHRRSPGLISAALLTGFIMSSIVGIIGIIISQHFLNQTRFDNILLFVCCGLTGLAMVNDQAFVGMLSGGLRMQRQLLFSVLKLVFIIVVALWFSKTEDATAMILAAWVLAQIISLTFGELLMRWYGQTFLHRPDFALLSVLKTKVVDHYALDLGVQASGMIMPYMVTVLLSAESNAVFTVIWMVFSVASVIPGSLAMVLFPTIRADPKHYRDKMMLSLTLSLLFGIGFGFFVFFYSTDILAIFNPTYANIADSQLRLLGFGMIGAVVKHHVCAASRLNNRMRQAAPWLAAAGVAEMVIVAAGCRIAGLTGAAAGWSLVLLAEGALMMLFMNPCRERVRP